MAYEDLFDPADNTKAKAGINLRYGIEAAPDLAARDAALAKRYGLPAGVIEQYRPDYDARAKVEDAGRMLDQSPKLRDWLAADPVRAKVSHDDIGNLSAIEKGIRYLVSAPDAPRGGLISDVGRAGKAIASGAPSAGGALYGAAASIAGLADQYVQTLDDLAALLTGTEKRQIVGTPGPESWLLDQQKQARGVAQGMLPDMQGMSPEERGLWSGLQSGGQNLLTLPLGIVGGEAMMLGTMGAFTFGQSYGKGREKLSPVQSVGFAAQDTVAEVVTEKYLGAGGLLKNIKAGQSAGKLFMYELSKEVPGEIAATIWQNFNEWLNVSPDKSVADFVMEQPDAIRETIVATLVGGTTQIGAVKGVEKVMGLGSNEMDRAMRAEKSALGLDQLSKLVEASKLRERSPEKLAEFTQQLTEESVPNVYVNGTALNQSGVDLQALAEALPSVAAQVQRAVATGGDIVIPTAEFLTITPGQPFAKALIEHARTAPDAMSKAEGTQWMKENGDALQAEIAKVLETRQADDAFQADRQAVQDQFLAQLTQTKRFRPEVNKAYATLLSDFYAAQASRAGMTAQELAQRYPVRIQATAPGGGRSYQQDQQLMVLRTAAVDASKAFDAMDAAAAGGEQVDPDEYMRLAEEHSNAQDALSTGIAAIPDEVFGLQAETRDGRLLVLNASAQQAGKWQLTRFDKDGVPFMDTQHDTKLFAVKEFVHESDPASIKSYDQTLNQSAQLPATIDIDGQQRPTTNSKGQQIAATEEGVRNFWRWFGDSKVVDADGKPLVVYHGTGGDFTQFDPGRVGENYEKGDERGFFFTSKADEADWAADRGAEVSGGNANIMPVYLSLQDPYNVEVPSYAEARGFGDPSSYFDNNTDQIMMAAEEGDHDGVGIANPERGYSTYIAFDPEQIKSATGNRGTFDPANPSILNQGKANLAEIRLPDAGVYGNTSVITLFENANLSSLIHEAGHLFLELQADMAGRIQAAIDAGEVVSDGERGIVADMNALLDWFGVKGNEQASALTEWLGMTVDERRQMHEQFARGFEAYAFEGKSPSQALNGIFAKFRAWMLSVYKSLKSLNVTLTDEVRRVMDRMLATDEQIAEQQAALKMGPLFATAEQAGMTPEQWAQYQGLAEQATQQAVEALERRAMKDMAWQRNATARALKAAQRRAAGVRREVEREVRAEVMSRPVYRAWQFLTGKGDPIDTATPAPKERKSKALDNANDNLFTAIAKLGGLDKAELKAQWGLDTTAEELKSGVFGMPVVRRDNGHSLDRMAEMLVEEGYLLPDENGKANLADLEEAFDAQRRGEDIYSTWYDYAERYKDRGPDLLPDNAIFGKLRTEDLRERYGTGETAIWRKLSELRMTSDANGIDPDVVAASFEFGSGDELVRALVDARAPQAVIDEETDARMLQEFGDISSPEALQKAADEAVHNEVRARAIAAELSALEEANNVKQKIPGTRRTVDLLAKAAKDYADGVIRALKVRDVRPAQYAAAEVRAANAAAKAFKKGDTAAAAEAKRNQLIQNLAAKAAHKAQADIDSALAYFKRMQKPGKLPAAHFEQIQALLSKFDLRASQSLKSIDNATRHRTWVKAQLDAGNVPPNVDALLTKEQRAAYLRELESRNDDGDLIYPNEEDQALLLAGYIDATPVRSYKEATVEEIIGLRDTIKQIEHIGRRTKKVLADRKNREFQAVVDEMRDRLVEVATKRGRKATDTRSPNDKAGQKRLSWRGYFFSHIKVANLLHIMDGGAGGPMWEHLMKTANDAANGEVLDVAKAHNEIQALLKDVKALGDITDKAIHFPSIGRSLNRQARIVMAMNLGNESNQQRLLAGEGWTMAQVKPVLDTLTAADWKFVQGMWDHFESYRERVGDMEKLINGVEPEWVEARPFSVKAAGGEIIMMRGGYAPVIYDPRANGRAQSFAAEKDAKDMMQAARVASTVSKSFTKARVEEVKGRPLMLSLDAMIGGVQDTIHYLHWQPWIIDANRMIKALDAPLREHYGAEVVKQLREWAGDNAAGVRPARDAAERAVTNLARNVSFAGLAFNVLSAAKQVTGYSQSVAVIGAKWMGKGVAHTLKSPRKAYLEAVEKSDFMKKRATTRMRDLAEVNNTVQDQGKVRDFLDKGGYAMMLAMQSAVDLPTWWGGYEKAINDGKDEIDAVAMADQAVIDAQGSGLQKDLSSIERATGAIRLLTGFMSFMNTTLNVNYRVFKSEQSVPAKAFDLVMVNAIPVALSMILAAALTPGDSGDDDPEKVAKKLAADGLGFMLGQFVGLREIQQIGYAAMGMPQGDYGGAVGLRMFGDTLKLAKQVGQGSWDDAARKAAVNFAGDWFRLPAAQINRSVTGIEALAEGKTTNPGAILTGYQEPR